MEEKLIDFLLQPTIMSSNSDVPLFTYDETLGSLKLARKAKEAPFPPIGIADFVAIVAYGLYKLKSRGNSEMSVHLIHMHVGAQGFVVRAMTIDMLYSTFWEYWAKPKSYEERCCLHVDYVNRAGYLTLRLFMFKNHLGVCGSKKQPMADPIMMF
ncbi:HIG1 domain family member 1A, mitochondrial-like [Gracilinanus agilis]|uniref:HIG1 domain family member 1A, mitochondrial-like n=1 Tax=Gracilinanus agilis TaxID=191870 RepID=UPI001CFD1E3D|nr:HIG1 domain family member 1A, mitochondrial-like [Gracilinanus agilis]